MSNEPIAIEGGFPVHFRYTAGIAGERFLREIKENGKLVASHCNKCELNYLPPRIYCERCMSKLEEYVEIENKGVVEASTVCHQDAEGKKLPQSAKIALVRFPNAHGGIVHRCKQVVSVGDSVRVAFKDKAKRTGSILDIEGFERLP